MTLLVLGVFLWVAAHLFKRVLPELREALGSKGKALVAATIVTSVVFMVLGYRAAEIEDVLWIAPSFAFHINNLLVLIAIFMMSPAPRKGRLLNKMRHPMLAGFALWAVAHIWVNGDLPSLILFGGLLVWALVEMQVINRAEGPWQPTETGTVAKDGIFFVASIVLMGVIGFVHGLIGPSPFGG